MDDFDFRGKTVLVRIDINSPYNQETAKIEENPRITEHASTLRELSDKKARVVALAHQGRKGAYDFIELQQHSELLTKHVEKTVHFVEDVCGEKAKEAIKAMKEEEIILLDNVRLLDEEILELPPEEHSVSSLVVSLAPLAHYFVNDAFSAAHRSHASIVGFALVLPSCAGRVMQREYEGAIKASERAQHPCVYLLGGAKPPECLKLMAYAASSSNVDKILVSGVFGELCLIAKGFALNPSKQEYLEQQGFTKFLPQIKEVVSKYAWKIETPTDFAVEENSQRKEVSLQELPSVAQPIYDIGSKTAEKYSQIISEAKTVYLKGPCGVYENPLFEHGTKTVLYAIANSSAYSLLGGGHTLSALQKFGIPKERISYTSLAGGALISMLSGQKLPGIEALKKSFQKFSQSTF